MIKAILFDLDETIVDRETTLETSLKSQYSRLNLQTPTYEIYRERFKQLDAHGYTDRFKLYQTLVTEFALPLAAESMVADFRQNAWLACQVFPDAHDVLVQLRLRGYRLGIITNGTSQTQRAKLRSANLLGQFDVILISEEEAIKKPDPVIFQRAAAKLNFTLEECIFVGDHPINDVVGAIDAGMQAIWRKGYLPWPEQLQVAPQHTIDALSQLLVIVF